MIVHEARKLFRFCISGGISTFTDFALYVYLSDRWDITFAKCSSMIISCVVSFILNRSWTFQVRGKTEARQIIKYIVSQILNICVNVAVNTEIYSIFQNKPAAYLAATSAGMTVNFLLQRFFVFTRAEGEEN